MDNLFNRTFWLSVAAHGSIMSSSVVVQNYINENLDKFNISNNSPRNSSVEMWNNLTVLANLKPNKSINKLLLLEKAT